MGELNNALSTKQDLMCWATGSVTPILFLVSEGEPTDTCQAALGKVKQNNWYKVVTKAAVGYNETSYELLLEFTEAAETVMRVDNLEDIERIIQYVTVGF